MVHGLILLLALGHAGSASFPVRAAKDYTCEDAQTGYHIIEKGECGLRIWKESKKTEPIVLDYANGQGCTIPEPARVREDILEAVGVQRLEEYQPKPRYFDAEGSTISKQSVWDEVLDSGAPIFLIEGGEWQWPPVEIGFRQIIGGVDVGGQPVEIETLATTPPIFKVHNLATKQETQDLIDHSKPHFVKADVVYMDKDKGKDVNEFRTSLNYRPRHNATPLLATMEARASVVTRQPFSHLEEVQILYYAKGGFYHAHMDAGGLEPYMGDLGIIRSRHYGYFGRMLTLFWYMNDVTEGGETNFPKAGGLADPPSMKRCTQGIRVKPVAGQAVLWYNMHAKGFHNPYALHAACVVEQGEKYAINIWIYNKPYHTPHAKWLPQHPRVIELERATGRKAGSNKARGKGDRSSNPKGRKLTIVNSGSSDIQVFYKGEDGFVPMGDPIATSSTLDTFVGHTFVAKRDNIEVASYTVTKAQDQTFDVGDFTRNEL